jgi:subtilase family serine protease
LWLSLCISQALAQPSRITSPLDVSKTKLLIGNRTRRARQENDQGPLNPYDRISGITLILKPSPDQAGDLDKLLHQQREPSSPNYRAWLTPEQYASRFGLSANDFGQVVSWLQTEGFSIDYVARGRRWIMFSGTAREVLKAFHTEVHRYNVGGELHYANAQDPSIPEAFDPVVLLIRGLDDFRTEPRKINGVPVADFSVSGGFHALVPGDLATIYDVQPLYQRGITGSGQKVAVVGQTDIQLSDIEYFRSQDGLPVNDPQLVLVTGSPDPGNSADDLVESDLDLEYAGGIAPNATILFVYSTDVWTSIEFAIDQDLAPVISSSYGYCEPQISSTPASAAAYLQSLAQEANSMGITWVASSGDTGAADCDFTSEQVATQGLAVDLPASIPEVTGVGGTEFAEGSGNYWSSTNNSNGSSALSYIPETAWNDTAAFGALVASGGGASIFFAKPEWQSGAGVPADGARDVPDIAFAAAVAHDPYQIYTSGSTLYVGGTSAPTPVFSGMLALLNQYQVSSGAQSQPGLGNINPALYRLAQTTPGIFHDVTVGNNIVPCQSGSPECTNGQFGYQAGVGYDQATGLGSLDAYNFVIAWNGSQPIASTTSLAATVSTLSAGGSTVLTATVKAAFGTTSPAGAVTFAVGQHILGAVALSGSGGVATATLQVNASQLASGANTITASYAGNALFTASSANLLIIVNVQVAAVSVTPSSGSGTSQTFALQYTDTAGSASLKQVWVYFNSTLANPASNACMLYYNTASNQMNLLNDNATSWLPATVGTATTLQNSQCSLNVAATTVVLGANTLTLSVPMTFKPAYAGAKNTYLHAVDVSGSNSGWQPLGAWTVAFSSGTPSSVSVSPNSGTGTSQTFALQYSDTAGASSLGQVWVYFNATLANPASNACMLYYNTATNQINLLNDNATAFQLATAGAATTLQNSQCSLNVAATTVALNSNTLTLNVALTFKPAYVGVKNIYMHAVDMSGSNSGWQAFGSWTVALTSGTPSTISVSPSSGSGTNQTFALQYSDTGGSSSLEQVWVYFNATLANPASNACLLYYNTATNQINLLNDSATIFQPATLGATSTLQNSQCSLNVAASTVILSGNTLTLNLAMTFKPAYVGAKNIYLNAVDVSGTKSGWQPLGTWTVAVN